MSPSQKKRKYTYADYLTWDDSERIEIIDGILYHTYGGEIMEDALETAAEAFYRTPKHKWGVVASAC